MLNDSIFSAFKHMWNYVSIHLEKAIDKSVSFVKEYSMPKYNEGILTYQDDPELDGSTYCVDISDLTELKVGMELTIIPHVTSVIADPSLSINGGEKIGMSVMGATTNSSFNATSPDFMNAGAPVKLMYTEDITKSQSAYAVLSNGQIVTMVEAGSWANGYGIQIYNEADEEGYFILFNETGEEDIEKHYFNDVYDSGILDISEITDWGVSGYYQFSNGTDPFYFWRIMNSVRVGVDINENSVLTATSTDGVAYTATLDGITNLYNGLQIRILPNIMSTSKSATLNLNGLGAKPIRLAAHGTGGAYYAYNEGFLAKNKPVILMYDATGERWITVNINRPVAEAISGQVSVLNGGTGRNTLTSGYYLVGNGNNNVALKSKSAVLSDIGAVSIEKYNELLARVEALEGSGVIRFSIDNGNDIEYYNAKNGMTWEDFINSSYNTVEGCSYCEDDCPAFEIQDGRIHFNKTTEGCYREIHNNGGDYYFVLIGEDPVSLNSTINNNGEYNLGNP